MLLSLGVVALFLCFKETSAFVPPLSDCAGKKMSRLSAISQKEPNFLTELDFEEIRVMSEDRSGDSCSLDAMKIMDGWYKFYENKTLKDINKRVIKSLYAPRMVNTWLRNNSVDFLITFNPNPNPVLPMPTEVKKIGLPHFLSENRNVVEFLIKSINPEQVAYLYYMLPDAYKKDKDFTLLACQRAAKPPVGRVGTVRIEISSLVVKGLKQDAEVMRACSLPGINS